MSFAWSDLTPDAQSTLRVRFITGVYSTLAESAEAFQIGLSSLQTVCASEGWVGARLQHQHDMRESLQNQALSIHHSAVRRFATVLDTLLFALETWARELAQSRDLTSISPILDLQERIGQQLKSLIGFFPKPENGAPGEPTRGFTGPEPTYHQLLDNGVMQQFVVGMLDSVVRHQSAEKQRLIAQADVILKEQNSGG